MALIHCNFSSTVLQLDMGMDVILPEPAAPASGVPQPDLQRHPVLYLLHGLSDDHTIWQRRTSIERYVKERDLVVVMPAVQRSFYSDMACGGAFWTYVSEEVPALAQSFFPITGDPAQTFVAGLSMGGFGAFKLALNHPERFGAAASLSGAVDIIEVGSGPGDEWQREMRCIFGDPASLPGSSNDLFHLAEKLAKSGHANLPLYQFCGTDDFLYGQNQRFRAHAEGLGLNLTYAEGPGGHEWSVWDAEIQQVLDWLPLKTGV